MPTPVLYRKWRPQTLGQVVGQDHVTRTLINALAKSRVAHAYLFCGPRGTGKTSTARILAKAVNCLNNDGKGEPCGECTMCLGIAEGRALDLVEIDAASNRGIDDIRDLRDKIGYSPNEARYKVYVIDEVHMLTDPAFNALLKTLEEPPPHAIFVLATTEVHRVPVTILSRCQRFDFRRIPQQALTDYLARICDAEGIEYELPALDSIARSSHGSARDAINLLEQVEVAHGGRVPLEGVQALLGLTSDPRALELVKAVAAENLTEGMTVIQQVRDDGVNLQQFGREVAGYLRVVLMLKAGLPDAAQATPEALAELKALANSVPLDRAVQAVHRFTEMDFHGESASSLPLELAFIDTVLAEQTPAPAAAPARAAAAPAPREARPAQAARTVPPPAAAREQVADPASEPAAVAFTKGEALDIDTLRQVMKGVKVPQMKFIESLLRNGCTIEEMDGQDLVLGFKPGLVSHKQRMERPENLRMAEQAIQELTGTAYRIRCVIVEQDGPPQSTASGHLVRAALDAGARHAT